MFRKKSLLLPVLLGIFFFFLVRIWKQRKWIRLQGSNAKSEQLILIDERSDETQNTDIPPSAKTQHDNLQKIEGIGPRIAGILQNAGITTFKQLSNTDVSTLKEILRNSNLRLANPETWPEQALYATKADWESLSFFQNQLKGGIRQ